jgi:predicted  nucleic acid-binding Zn-ribbon protein
MTLSQLYTAYRELQRVNEALMAEIARLNEALAKAQAKADDARERFQFVVGHRI